MGYDQHGYADGIDTGKLMERPDCKLLLTGDYEGGVSLTCECLKDTGGYIYGNQATASENDGLQLYYSLDDVVAAGEAHKYARRVERHEEVPPPDMSDYLDRMADIRSRLVANLKLPYGLVGYVGGLQEQKDRELAAALAEAEGRVRGRYVGAAGSADEGAPEFRLEYAPEHGPVSSVGNGVFDTERFDSGVVAAMAMHDRPEYHFLGPLPGAEERRREVDRWKR